MSTELPLIDAPNVGTVPELIHLIGSFLRQDNDFQSIGRMSSACKMNNEDTKGWMEVKKESYRVGFVRGWAVTYLSEAKAALVQYVYTPIGYSGWRS